MRLSRKTIFVRLLVGGIVGAVFGLFFLLLLGIPSVVFGGWGGLGIGRMTVAVGACLGAAVALLRRSAKEASNLQDPNFVPPRRSLH